MADTLPWVPGVVFVRPGEPGNEDVWEEDNRRRESIWLGDGLAVAAHLLNQFDEEDELVGESLPGEKVNLD